MLVVIVDERLQKQKASRNRCVFEKIFFFTYRPTPDIGLVVSQGIRGSFLNNQWSEKDLQFKRGGFQTIRYLFYNILY